PRGATSPRPGPGRGVAKWRTRPRDGASPYLEGGCGAGRVRRRARTAWRTRPVGAWGAGGAAPPRAAARPAALPHPAPPPPPTRPPRGAGRGEPRGPGTRRAGAFVRPPWRRTEGVAQAGVAHAYRRAPRPATPA